MNGYIGHSMSVRAAEAYAAGEAPLSKWTKRRILDAIDRAAADADGMDEEARRYVHGLTRAELAGRFLRASSWHHTSKFYNRTEFYDVDRDAVADYANRPTRRLYTIRYRLGSHETPPRTYPTRRAAMDAARALGFEPTALDGAMLWRGRFTALIVTDEVEL